MVWLNILVKAEYLFDGYRVRENIDLSVVDGVVKYGKAADKYDHVFEAKYVLPALIDGHLHLTYDRRPKIYRKSITNVAKLFIIHGVLGVRDTGNYLGVDEVFHSFSKLPLIKTTYVIEKPPLNWPFMRPVFSLNDLEIHVKRALVEGCSWFKLYVNVDDQLVDQTLKIAREHGLKITGHVNSIGIWKAIKAGFNCVEHLDSVGRIKPRAKLVEAWEEIDEGEIEEVAKAMAEKNICLVPTMSVYRAATGRLVVDKRKYSRYVTPWYKWMGRMKIKELKKIYDKLVKALKILWENNVKIMAGTDLPNFALNPGISLWEEIQGYIEAGLDLWEALKTATGNASQILDMEIGVVEEGGIANLLLYNRKPLEDRDVIPEKIIYKDEIIEPEKLLNELEKLPFF